MHTRPFLAQTVVVSWKSPQFFCRRAMEVGWRRRTQAYLTPVPMTPDEVNLMLEQLRDAADTLRLIRQDCALIKISCITAEGKALKRVKLGIALSESTLRRALEPIGEFEV